LNTTESISIYLSVDDRFDTKSNEISVALTLSKLQQLSVSARVAKLASIAPLTRQLMTWMRKWNGVKSVA